ncbi:MAG: (2Fe-2S)-binding protein [Rhodobacteraceae bacterium]|nr:(2Fe-2S)-binding protein [Paracoccaceae bacterium]
MALQLRVNGRDFETDVPAGTPLLWVLRDELGLTGTKYGCGVSACGACTVHVGGQAVRACQTPVGDLWGEVTTIEGAESDRLLSALQQAWQSQQVAQCGYCQPGQIMQAGDLLAHNPAPTDAEIDDAMAGNLCRCGTYMALRAAIHKAAASLRDAEDDGRQG